MYPMLGEELARQNNIEAHRRAAKARRARYASDQSRAAANTHPAHDDDIAIRDADAGDVLALMRLSELDSRELPSGRVLVAQVGGRVRAALSIETGEVVADPFVPTDHLVALLELRAQQVEPLARTDARKRRVLGLLSPRHGRAI